jgi:hypothetical protein
MAALSLSLVSCSTYHMSVVNSVGITKDKSTGQFVHENDSVKITYSFYGFDAPVNIRVFNKLDKPLYVDWQRSALIINGQAESYAGKQITIQGNVDVERYRMGHLNFSSESISAGATLPNDMTFVPPHSEISNTPGEIPGAFDYVQGIDANKQQVSELQTVNGGVKRVKTVNFTDQNTPLKFKSYLTLYAADGNSAKPLTLVDEFYISMYIKSSVSPARFQIAQNNPGDLFYISHLDNLKTQGLFLLAFAATVAVALVTIKP